MSSPAMNEPLSGVPQHAEVAELQANEPVGVQLDNGVRVVAVARKHPLVSVGVYVEAGSRFESHATAGSAFFLSQLYTKVRRISSFY
jgi:predicted Zn-dependent peptidase